MGEVVKTGVLEAMGIPPQEPNAPRSEPGKVTVAPLDAAFQTDDIQPHGGESRTGGDTPVLPQLPVGQRV